MLLVEQGVNVSLPNDPIAIYQIVIQHFPVDHFYHGMLATAYLFAQSYDLASESFDMAISLNPRNSQVVEIGNITHGGVTCDHCKKPILGIRHVCAICRIYDLCNGCKSISPHPHPGHRFIPIPSQRFAAQRYA
jgi:hypothetical protein